MVAALLRCALCGFYLDPCSVASVFLGVLCSLFVFAFCLDKSVGWAVILPRCSSIEAIKKLLCVLGVLCPENPYAARGVVSTFRPSSSKRFV